MFLGALGEKRNQNDVMNYSTVDPIQFKKDPVWHLASTTSLHFSSQCESFDSKTMENHQEGALFNLPFEYLCVDAPQKTPIFAG